MRKIWILSLYLFPLLASQNLMADVEFSSTSLRVPRGDSSYLQLSFVLTNIPAKDMTSSSTSSVTQAGAEALLVSKLDVCLTSNDTNHNDSNETCPQKLLYRGRTSGDKTDSEDLSERYYMDFLSVKLTPDSDGDLYDLTVVLKIAALSTTNEDGEVVSTTFAANDSVELDYDAEEGQVSSTAVAVGAAPVSDEPSGLSASSQNQSVVVYWNDDYSVNFADSTTGSASGIRAYLIPVTKGSATTSQTLNIATTYSTTDTTEIDLDGCILSAVIAGPDQDNSCTFSCNSGGYINKTRITDELNIAIKETDSAGAISFSGSELLDPDDTEQPYAALVQYLPDGLLQDVGDGTYRASCVIGYATRTYTYAQLNGAGDPKQKDPTCFIATAAYGHPMHQALRDLRWFRDEVLLNFEWGKSFVKFYYKWSPNIARKIALNEHYKTTVRAILWTPVKVISWVRQGQGVFLLAVSFCIGITALLWALRRRLIKA